MLLSSLKVALITVAWIALPFAAGAQSGPANDPPTGDVWITPQSKYLFRPRSGVTTPAHPEFPLGDVWVTPNDITGNVERKAPQDIGIDTAAGEDVGRPK